MTDLKEFTAEDWTITVDHDLCVGHGICSEDCPENVYDIVEGKSVATRVDDCSECCICVEGCPEGAIQHTSC